MPATTILSLIITFFLARVRHRHAAGLSRDLTHTSATLAGWAVLVLAGSPILALPLTARGELGRWPKCSATSSATSHSDLIGKTCVVRTGTVNKTFGEAFLEDGGAGLVVRAASYDRESSR